MMKDEGKHFLDVPPVAVVYGDSKMGKTIDALYSFPNALFLAIEGGVKGYRKVVGVEPKGVFICQRLSTVLRALETLVKSNPHGYDAVVVDDFSLMCANQLAHIQLHYSGYQVYSQLNLAVRKITSLAREVKLPLIFLAHIKYPDDRNPKGGPDVGSRTLSLNLPKYADLVLRAEYCFDRTPWPAVYRSGLWSGDEWVTGDRHGVCIDSAPMNLAEIFRAAGYEIARHSSMDWAEKIVQKGAQAITSGEDRRTILGRIASKLKKAGKSETQIVWVLRDTQDRAELRSEGGLLDLFEL